MNLAVGADGFADALQCQPPAGKFPSSLAAIVAVWGEDRPMPWHSAGAFVVMHRPECSYMELDACNCSPTLVAPRQSAMTH